MTDDDRLLEIATRIAENSTEQCGGRTYLPPPEFCVKYAADLIAAARERTGAQRERDAEKAENEELRADLVWAVRTGIYGHGNLITPGDGTAHSFDGTDADLCRAIREARRGD